MLPLDALTPDTLDTHSMLPLLLRVLMLLNTLACEIVRTFVLLARGALLPVVRVLLSMLLSMPCRGISASVFVQCLYICTSKASKLSTFCVSICTFVLVKPPADARRRCSFAPPPTLPPPPPPNPPERDPPPLRCLLACQCPQLPCLEYHKTLIVS